VGEDLDHGSGSFRSRRFFINLERRAFMVKKQILVVFFLAIIATTSSYAASGEDILGVWNNQEKDAKIEINKCGEKYCGKIVWLKVPNYPEGSDE
jgi:uncharacterized protein (DUF2147 family)